ncbi:uncharacterized protein akna [Periophthalmus magnuspinnatus]|uniref:uncharacterized protein akna n=1 Tax=Periophthalmus magnuspinnatus TaxID=409849 RepID=UPI00243691B5|nr:uncharacterized protein akna [Periophthalmus magnuspinnatus]
MGHSGEEDREDVQSEMDQSRGISLDLVLHRIGLRDDEMGLGVYSGNASPENYTDNFNPLPAEGDDEDLDHGSGPSMVGTDLDVSDKEGYEPEQHCHTTKGLNDDVTPQKTHQVPRETSPNHHCPNTQPAAPSRAPSLPPLITPEELPSLGILDEIFPEIHWSQSSSSLSSPRPKEPDVKSHNPASETRALKEHGAVSKIPVKVSVTREKGSVTEETRLSTTSLFKAGPRSPKSCCQNKPSPEREKRAHRRQKKPALFSSGVPMALRPDLSKVEPRVHFPKDSYTPPQSRHPKRSDCQSPERPLVYMSPADIVTEVLFSPADDGADPEEEEHTLEALSIFPPDFRSKQQAIALVNELQEENSRLKLKCAEAANTIDRLRLEGKVNLYSDPPKPGLPLHSGLRTQASRPMTLEIPCPQRAEVSPSCPCPSPQTGARHTQHRSPVSSTSTSEGSGSDIFDTLYQQAHGFLQDVEAFEGSLQRTEGQTKQQMQVVHELLQRLESLEKSYLSAKKEHKQLQRQGVQTGSFDPHRELESLIFQCGLQMDEVKERVLQQSNRLAPPICQAPPTHQTTPPQPLQTPPLPIHAAVEVPQYSSSPSSTCSSVRRCNAAERLYQQTEAFLDQVKACEENLRAGKLEPQHQAKLVQELLQKADTLERRYQSAEKEHERRQRQSEERGCFDPQRELYSLILQISLQINQLQQHIIQREATPSHQATPSQQQATPTNQSTPLPSLPTQPQCSAQCRVQRIQCDASSAAPGPPFTTVLKSPQPQTPAPAPDPLKAGHDEPDYIHLYHSLRVLPVPLVKDLNCHGRPVTAGPQCECEEAPRLSMANAQTPYRHRETDNAQPSHPPTKSNHPQDLPQPSPSSSTPQVDSSFTAEALDPHTHSTPSRGRSEMVQSTSRGGSEMVQSTSRGGSEMGQSTSRGGSEMGQSTSRGGSEMVQSTSRGGSEMVQSTSRGGSEMIQSTSRGGSEMGQSTSRGGSQVGQPPNSSLSSMREAPDRTGHICKVEQGSQDGLISPGADSGFVGSEGSHLTPAAVTSPVHQREPSDGLDVPFLVPSPGPSMSRQTKEGLVVKAKPSLRSRRGGKRRASSASCSQLPRGGHMHSDCSQYSSTTSEEVHSDLSSGSSLSRCGPSSNRHGDRDPLKVPNTGRGARPNELFHELQAEVLHLRDNMDWFVRNRADRNLPSTSTPISRSDRHKAAHRDRRDRGTTEDGTGVKRQTDHTRAVLSKLSQTDSCFPQQVSRLTQTSADPLTHPETEHRPHLRHSSERTGGGDRDSRASVCVECLRRGRSRGMLYFCGDTFTLVIYYKTMFVSRLLLEVLKRIRPPPHSTVPTSGCVEQLRQVWTVAATDGLRLSPPQTELCPVSLCVLTLCWCTPPLLPPSCPPLRATTGAGSGDPERGGGAVVYPQKDSLLWTSP